MFNGFSDVVQFQELVNVSSKDAESRRPTTTAHSLGPLYSVVT